MVKHQEFRTSNKLCNGKYYEGEGITRLHDTHEQLKISINYNTRKSAERITRSLFELGGV
jgi:hypothetical protein